MKFALKYNKAEKLQLLIQNNLFQIVRKILIFKVRRKNTFLITEVKVIREQAEVNKRNVVLCTNDVNLHVLSF